MKPLFRGEYVGRSTLTPEAAQNAELLYALLINASLLAYRNAVHYDHKAVSAVMPAYDALGNLKLLSGSNYKPRKFMQGDTIDTRVCGEPALLQQATHENDLSGGVLFVRGHEDIGEVEGNKPSDSLHPCVNCRPKLKRALGTELVVVTFTGENPEPVEAFTLSQMIDYHDDPRDVPYPEAPQGISVREFAVTALAEGAAMSQINVDRSQRFRTLRPHERS